MSGAAREAYVDHVAFALGEEERKIAASSKAGDLVSDLEALQDAGFQRHWTCKSGTTAYDLARRAVEQIPREALDRVGAIVYATCLPLNGNLGDPARYAETRDVKHLMDFPASRLQADLSLDRAFVLGLNQQACTSMLGSLRLARWALMDEPEIGAVLCVSADRFPANAVYEQAYNLISDGAAACVVSLAPVGYRVVACHQATNGAMATADDDETVGSYFSYAHRVIKETLAKAKIGMDRIAWVVPQNTSDKAWRILAKILRFDFERVYQGSLADVGHVISQDNMINLVSLEKTGRLKSGDHLLLFMAGFGLNWQCVILEKV